MANNDTKETRFQDTLGSEIIQNSKFHVNLAQDVVVITEDKLRLCLTSHLGRLLAKHAWVTPVSLFVTIIVVFVTSSFKDVGLPAATWQAIFVICAIGTAIWSVVAAINALSSNTKLDKLIGEIKKTSEELKGN